MEPYRAINSEFPGIEIFKKVLHGSDAAFSVHCKFATESEDVIPLLN